MWEMLETAALSAKPLQIVSPQGPLKKEFPLKMLPKAHFVTIYAKPEGRPLVDQYLTEVAQQCWIQFPWDMGIAYVEPLADQMKK